MSFSKIIIFNLLLLYSFNSFSHNPEDLVIAEIEQGQMTFENEQITKEYNAALKRLRMRRIEAMSFQKKFLIFTKSGFNHIIPKGLDHILFVLGLFFSFLSFRSLLFQVTAFTMAHSITLVLAGIGWIELQSTIIEPLIALSIVWIAIENCIFKKPNKWRFLLIFIFGLIHGMGFATVLSHYGIPKDNFLSSLLAFNIGVEIGQLSILMMAFILTRLILKKNWQNKQVKISVSIIIGLIGLFWFIERLLN